MDALNRRRRKFVKFLLWAGAEKLNIDAGAEVVPSSKSEAPADGMADEKRFSLHPGESAWKSEALEEAPKEASE